jgi:hypothetical protein
MILRIIEDPFEYILTQKMNGLACHTLYKKVFIFMRILILGLTQLVE